MKALNQPKFTGILWLVARLWLGYEWFSAGYEKVFGEGNVVWVGSKAGAVVGGFLKGAIAQSPLAPNFDPIKNAHPAVQAWYAYLARDVFLPNAALFSHLVAYGELLVGIALILGVFTHFAALMGIFMNLAYLFAGTTSTNPNMLVVGMVILLAGGVAVGYYGVDFFARPIELKVLRRAHLLPEPAAG
ncbi:MAG TPA: DoxX family protein [Kouleothrix sp.]|uniref:DoxX family membrane protein n=1 Tax=Kouleothrix sp. TaxID=2779161 RepID=UPI002CDC362E|nr:DoxX family protein [Kouleothrix sp.]HRC77257.1 DoxX family protein [Kouleothrix sp.]